MPRNVLASLLMNPLTGPSEVRTSGPFAAARCAAELCLAAAAAVAGSAARTPRSEMLQTTAAIAAAPRQEEHSFAMVGHRLSARRIVSTVSALYLGPVNWSSRDSK